MKINKLNLDGKKDLIEVLDKIFSAKINKKLVDTLYWFRASKLIGNEGLNAVSNLSITRMKSVKELKLISSMQIQSDTLEVYGRK